MDTNQFLSRLPHKNLIVSGLVALTIIGVGVFTLRDHVQIPNTGAENSLHTTSSATPSTVDLVDRDTDQDGIPDWEENLQGSNPFNADTDGDGTFDGKELSLGRDPLKRGPDDKLPVVVDPSFATSSTDLTGIKKEYFAKYLSVASKKIREESYLEMMKTFDPKKFKPTTQLLDLNVSSDVNPEALHAYGNAFGLLIRKHTATKLRTEAEILKDGMETKNDASLSDLQLLVLVYRSFAKDLRAMPVPIPLAKFHLAVVNGYDGMANGLVGMMHMYSVPIDGAGGYETYTRYRYDVTNGYAGIVAHLESHKITYAPNEPGFPFYRVTIITSVPGANKESVPVEHPQ